LFVHLKFENKYSKLLIITLFLVLGFISGQDQASNTEKYSDPIRFEEAIQAFEYSDSINPPQSGGIVCIGSSSIRAWRNIKSDLEPFQIIQRGFGGSNMNDALYYINRIVINYNPRAVILYEGDNDIAQDISPQQIKAAFLNFATVLHKFNPEINLYFISIKPSLARWQLWPQMKSANELIKYECEQKDNLIFIDVSTSMLNKQGEAIKDIYLIDKLHLNKKGYKIWSEIIRPVLLKNEKSD